MRYLDPDRTLFFTKDLFARTFFREKFDDSAPSTTLVNGRYPKVRTKSMKSYTMWSQAEAPTLIVYNTTATLQ